MTSAPLRTLQLPTGESLPVVGLGTWGMGEDASRRGDEVSALQLGLALGMTLIDTAEMYATGGAEEVVGQAIEGRRDEVFLVSKVLPHHAARQDLLEACEASLRRLGTDYLDLYLLHWRGTVPLRETVEALRALVNAGKIRHWGVSNFDTDAMTELISYAGGVEVATNQVLYNLMRRGIEYDLLPWCRLRALPVMAYSPVEQGRLLTHPTLREVACRRDATPAQVALAWLLRHNGVLVIPKATTPAHVRQNQAVLELKLEADDFSALDRAFPPPLRPRPLEML